MKFFYLKNYRLIHHILFALELWFFLWIWGVDGLLYPSKDNIPFIIFMLIINFVFADLSLKWSGLKKLIDGEIEDIKRQIREYEKEQKQKEN